VKRKYGKKASEKVERALHEMKRGTLRSGRSGRKVTSRAQAIAIGLSQARRAGGKVPPAPGHATKYRPKYGDEAGAWESGFQYGSEAARHETRATARAILGQLRAQARTDFDRGQVAAYERMLGDHGSTSRHHASRKKYPYIAYWVRTRGGPRSSWDIMPIYVLGTTTRADEGIVGHDLRVRPLHLGKGPYTVVISPDDVEDRP